jgi:hypothetical protein
MTFKEWKKWYKSLPGAKKWFVVLILIRPLVDNFWDLKHISAFVSPLYYVGILTPFFIFRSLRTRSLGPKIKNQTDSLMSLFSFFTIISCIAIMTLEPGVSTLGDVLKMITPVLLYIYLRRFIQSESDLTGVLQAFMYACIFPGIMRVYENIFGPIAVQYLTEGRGGGTRYRGGYADVMSYAIYMVGFWMIACYQYIKGVYEKKVFTYKNYGFMFFAVAISLLMLISIKHVSTWSVFLVTSILFFRYNLNSLKGLLVVGVILLALLPFYGQVIYQKQILPLIQKEINVADGVTDESAAFNGRVGRWERYFDSWGKEGILTQLLGVPFSTLDNRTIFIMIGNGMHNDYVRLIFFCGLIGTISYLLWYFSLFKYIFKLKPPEQFLFLSALAALFLHSMSTLPLLYPLYMYLLLPIIGFSMLKQKKKLTKVQAPLYSIDKLESKVA